MTLADTTAWVEFARDRRTVIADRLADLIRAEAVATTQPVLMEILAGARSTEHERELGGLLGRCPLLSVGRLGTWESAARVYRVCRSRGFTPRSQHDCLIAAVAIREEVPVLHADRDFDLIAQHTPLQVVPV